MHDVNYYEPFISNNIIYSCDMIRLKFYFRHDCPIFSLNEFERYLNIILGFSSEYYSSSRLSSYRHLFIFKKGDCTITVGIEHNQKDTTGEKHNFIEFNPNKADMRAVDYLLHYFCTYCRFIDRNKFYEVVRWDLAVDIPISRQYVKLLKSGKRRHTRIEEGGAVTEWLGKHNTNGFVKVYDKTKESDLYYDLTRIEITCDSPVPVLPEIHLMQYQTSIDFDFDLDSTDKVLVELIRRLEDDERDYWFRQLGRCKRQKLKPYIFSEKDMFTFDKIGIMHVTDVIDQISMMDVHYDGKGVISDVALFEQSAVSLQQYNKAAEQSSEDWQAVTDKERDIFNDDDIKYNTGDQSDI